MTLSADGVLAIPEPSLAEDEHFMRLAIGQALLGDQTQGAGEVGCVIVRNRTIQAAGHNEVHLRNDPTAHAEIVALRRLGAKLGTADFNGCTLYVTLQPCSMCAAACVWAKIARIVYGASRNDVHSMYFDTRHLNAAELIADAFRTDISITGNVLSRECARFYYGPGDHPPPEEQENR